MTLEGNAEFLDRPANASEELVAIVSTRSMASTASSARKRVVEMMEARELLDKIERSHAHGPAWRPLGAVIEPWLTDQWYVDAKTLAQPALAAVRDGKTKLRPEELGKDLFRMAREYPALVHLAPALVGPSNSRPGMGRDGDGLRRVRRKAEAEHRRSQALRRADGTPHSATRTSSTPGSPPRSGLSRRSAGRTRRRSSRAAIRPACSSPASTSSSSGSPG